MKLTKEEQSGRKTEIGNHRPPAQHIILGAAPHPASGQVDSLTPARSTLNGPPPLANSFRSFPSHSSLPRAEKDISPKGGAGQARRAEWWAALPAGEKSLLRMVVDHLRKAKADPNPKMAAAAAKWETRLICFIKFRLIGQAARRQRAAHWRQACRA